MTKKIEIRNSTAEFLIFMLEGKEDGVHVLYKDETIWATQKAMADLFDVGVPAISKHLKNIFEEGELMESSVISKMETPASDGKSYNTSFYSLDSQVRRNLEDFMFQLTMEELSRSQIATLTLLDKRDSCVSATVYTQQINNRLQLDIERHNAQYPKIDIQVFCQSHDRFLCIDNSVYHIGASIKDLGKKWFAFSKLEDVKPADLIHKINQTA